ncbi:hypothetical protein ACODT3_38635 [Streptomyces sp. 4.24]|uniref:hypothetical protein n=1 Tax=Streptomyces tritrimontium TaxID=3406573 RepID=UPI003BB78861
MAGVGAGAPAPRVLADHAGGRDGGDRRAGALALEAEAVRRVWLHTNSDDHPSALLNYRRRGLRVYRTETVE